MKYVVMETLAYAGAEECERWSKEVATGHLSHMMWSVRVNARDLVQSGVLVFAHPSSRTTRAAHSRADPPLRLAHS